MGQARIFISKSGAVGNRVAYILKNTFLNNAFGKKVQAFTSDDIPPGASWVDHLTAEGSGADIFIALVDEFFNASAWCNLEVGCFLGARSGIREQILYPIKIDEYAGNGVFPDKQFRQFDKKLLRELVVEIFNLNKTPDHQRAIPQDEISKALKAFDRRREVYDDGTQVLSKGNKLAEFHRRVNESIVRLGAIYSISGYNLSKYKEFWSYAANPKITDSLRDIGNAIVQSRRHQHESGKWSNIWEKMTLYQIQIAAGNLSKVSSKSINILDTHAITNFWIKIIMPNTGETIWTTNLPGTNGRKPGRAYLKPQEEAIRNGVTITRVFVFDPTDSDDCTRLRRVIEDQVDAGIDVYVITQSDFAEAIDNSPQHTTSTLDFMIIDERYTYKTILDKKSRFTRELIFEDSPKEFETLDNIRNQIMTDAIAVNSVKEFESILITLLSIS